MKTLENQLIKIKSDIAQMASIAMNMIKHSITALCNRDSSLAKEIFDRDDSVDNLEVEIEERCIETLALYDPKATDLRFVVTALRIIIDIERIGDLCVNISKQILKLNEIPQLKPYEDLPVMAEKVITMLSDVISAYFIKNDNLARDVIKRDDSVDDLNYSIIRELLHLIKDDQNKLEGALSLIFITKNFERIADHCTNIAELVIYMDTANIVKHNKELIE